jgi:LPXTG-motif cell wall-anchored protein
MRTRTSARRKLLAAIIGGAAAIALVASPAQASPAGAGGEPTEPPGNKGTVKIHRSTTPDSDRRDEPKVCAFRIVGFGFPDDSHIELSIEGHGGPNAGSGSFADTIEADELSADGDWAIAGPTLPDGMYKLTADNTTAPGNAKHKVFKVDCGGGELPTESTTGDTTTGGDAGGGTTGGTDGATAGGVAPNDLQQPAPQGADVLGATVERDVLPRTGPDVSGLIVLGAALLLGGAALVARRPRHAGT